MRHAFVSIGWELSWSILRGAVRLATFPARSTSYLLTGWPLP